MTVDRVSEPYIVESSRIRAGRHAEPAASMQPLQYHVHTCGFRRAVTQGRRVPKPVNVQFGSAETGCMLCNCRAHPDSQTQRLNSTVRAVRRALSLRRGKGGRIYDSMQRRSSASLHSPPPDCAKMNPSGRAAVSIHPPAVVVSGPGASSAARRLSDPALGASGGGEATACRHPAWETSFLKPFGYL